MKKHHFLIFGILCILLIIFSLCGCFHKQGGEEYTEFFLLKITEDRQSTDLYLELPLQKSVKIAANVDDFYFLRESDAFLLCEKADLLYNLVLQTKDGQKYPISKTVLPKSMKVTADETWLYFLGKKDSEELPVLYRYSLLGEQEKRAEEVASEIISYDLFAGCCIYVTNGNELYLLKDSNENRQSNGEKRLIATGVEPEIKGVKERVFYKTKDQEILCVYEEQQQKSRVIDKQVRAFQITAEGESVFYLTEQGELYCYHLTNNIRSKLDEWLDDFLIEKNGRMVIYKDKDQNVYLQERGEKRKKIGFGRSAWASADGKIFYLAYNTNLLCYTYGRGEKELATGVRNFILSPSGNSLAYYTIDGKLFFQVLSGERLEILLPLSAYYKVYFGNELLYEDKHYADVLEGIQWQKLPEGQDLVECVECQNLDEAEHYESQECVECQMLMTN